MAGGDVVLGRVPVAAAPPQDVLDSPEVAARVIRGSALRSLAYLVALLANVAALPLLFRHLGVEDSGRYVVVLTVATLVGAVVETGFGAISVREYARRSPQARPGLMADLIALRACALLACGALALAALAALGYPAVIVAGAALGVAGAFFEALSSTYSVWLSSNLRLGSMAVLQIVRQGAAVALTLALIALDAPLIAFFAVFAAAGVIQALAATRATHGVIPHLPARGAQGALALLRASAPFIAAMALSVLYFRLAMILMPALSSDRETGYLGIPFRLLEIITVISVLVLSSAFPIIARAADNDRGRHHYALLRLSQVALVGGLYVSVVAFVCAPSIVAILGGPGFEPATGLVRILALSFAAKFLIAAWAFSLLSLERPVAVLRANALATALALVLTLALVPAFAATGGAWATVVADLAVLLAYAWALAGGDDRLELPWGRFVALAIAAALAAATVLLPFGEGFQLVLATAFYGAALWALQMIPAEIAAALPWRSRAA